MPPSQSSEGLRPAQRYCVKSTVTHDVCFSVPDFKCAQNAWPLRQITVIEEAANLSRLHLSLTLVFWEERTLIGDPTQGAMSKEAVYKRLPVSRHNPLISFPGGIRSLMIIRTSFEPFSHQAHVNAMRCKSLTVAPLAFFLQNKREYHSKLNVGRGSGTRQIHRPMKALMLYYSQFTGLIIKKYTFRF